MNNCRVAQEEIQHDLSVMALESQPHRVKCLECKEVKPAEEIAVTLPYDDTEGCCDDCAMSEDIKSDWGIE